MGDIIQSLDDGVLELTLARPAKKNALTGAMYAEVTDAFERANADQAIGAILIAGEGGDFCSGNDLHDHLAGLMQIDVAQHWRPTAANYFDRVGKQQLLRHITDIGGTTMAASYMASKKGDLSQTCEKLFAGETIVAPEVKAAALAWVPDAIRFRPAAEGIADETAESEGAAEPLVEDAGEEPLDVEDLVEA